MAASLGRFASTSRSQPRPRMISRGKTRHDRSLRARERSGIGGPLRIGQASALEVERQVQAKHQVQPVDQERAERPAHERREEADPKAVVRPRPRVGDDERAHELRAAARQPQPDRPAPGVAEDDHPVEAEEVDQPLDHLRLGARRVVEAGRRLGQPEPRIVGRDAAERATQAEDDVAPPERPAGIAVQEQERRSGCPRRRSGRDGRRSRASDPRTGTGRRVPTPGGPARSVAGPLTSRLPDASAGNAPRGRRCTRPGDRSGRRTRYRCGAPGTPSACGSGRSWPGTGRSAS